MHTGKLSRWNKNSNRNAPKFKIWRVKSSKAKLPFKSSKSLLKKVCHPIPINNAHTHLNSDLWNEILHGRRWTIGTITKTSWIQNLSWFIQQKDCRIGSLYQTVAWRRPIRCRTCQIKMSPTMGTDPCMTTPVGQTCTWYQTTRTISRCIQTTAIEGQQYADPDQGPSNPIPWHHEEAGTSHPCCLYIASISFDI